MAKRLTRELWHLVTTNAVALTAMLACILVASRF